MLLKITAMFANRKLKKGGRRGDNSVTLLPVWLGR
jgi:hypothetical protein